ncbi:MAG: hypothetical protein JWO58_3285, partial [Chitinophagaceae bacterium]|nr:hypothetical protein [Chitinophagaceae bacterium]
HKVRVAKKDMLLLFHYHKYVYAGL